MISTLLSVRSDHPLSHAAGLLRAFALDGDSIDNLDAIIGNLLQGLEGKVGADSGAGAHGGDKADAVQPIIDPHAHAILDLEHLGHELRQK